MQDFPYNYNDLSLKFELESKFINVKGIKNNEEVEEKVEFGYIILDSTIPSNVYSVKWSEIDQLDTHDPFKN